MKTKDRTISTVLFKAAEEMERRYFFFDDFCSCCCPEIDRAAWNLYQNYASGRAQVFFAAHFMPRNKNLGDVWFGDLNERNIKRRIMALYFAAHAAYSEGL